MPHRERVDPLEIARSGAVEQAADLAGQLPDGEGLLEQFSGGIGEGGGGGPVVGMARHEKNARRGPLGRERPGQAPAADAWQHDVGQREVDLAVMAAGYDHASLGGTDAQKPFLDCRRLPASCFQS